MSQIVQNKNFDEFFEIITPLRLSCIMPSGIPSIVSLWYIYKNDKIYCVTQKNAKIVSYIKQNNRCAFEITTGQAPYKGIRGHGTVKLREDVAIPVLESLIDRFVPNKNSKLAKFLMQRKENEIALEITSAKLFPWDYSKRMKI